MLHCSVHLLLYGQSQRRMTNLHLLISTPVIYHSQISIDLHSLWPLNHTDYSFRTWWSFFLIFSRIFFLFSLPTPRSGVINWKGNDSGRQWLPAQEGEAAAPVGTGRTVGPWDSDVGSRDELAADNRREEQMLTKTLCTVLMARVRCNNIFINTSFSTMHLICSYSHTSKVEQRCQD